MVFPKLCFSIFVCEYQSIFSYHSQEL
uniref:Uncharacterized protein n=1 Tax=Anguilla anguilla TaxID=7936 RepID=A0A0E9RCP2_ANGAN